MSEFGSVVKKVNDFLASLEIEVEKTRGEAKTDRELREKADAELAYCKAQVRALQQRNTALERCLREISDNQASAMKSLELGQYASKQLPIPTETPPVKLNGGIEDEIRAAVMQTAKDQGRNGPTPRATK